MMMMMEYGSSQYASSTMSSETLSGSCGSRTNRIRTVRLVRPSLGGSLPPPSLTCRHGPNLGFSIRGGREHGTGFFVSYVEPASEAHRQGLRVGDQIIRVNGFTIDDAVHKEVLQLISNHTHLTLKVRCVGMIPVKDRKTDSLSWQIITDNNSSLRSSPQLGEKVHDVRISIMVAPRSKLGCGICKGPEWKPGIFIQFTKEGGIAREAGLRPGDQILYCNTVDFSDISFNEAVNLMKTARQLDLIVRKSAGSELFPGESSGYNSSASSVTGDQSPSWSDSKRLSIVKEESLDLEDRLSQLERLKCTKKWEKLDWEDVDTISEEKPYFRPTIINLSDNGTTTIKNNGSEECQTVDSSSNNTTYCTNLPKPPSSPPRFSDFMASQQHSETKTVVVEVHRSKDDNKGKTDNMLMKSSSTSSFGSLISNTSSLSSAICLEIQRRSEKNKIDENRISIDEQLQRKKILTGVATEQQQQHSKLMDEFKKAHRRMFKPSDGSDGSNIISPDNRSDKESLDRLASKELSQKLSERLSNLSLQENQDDRTTNINRRNSKPNMETPPPPPPLPPNETHNGMTNGTHNSIPNGIIQNGCSSPNTRTNTLKPNKTKPKAPPVPIKTSTLSTYYQPPPCPTPDYDTLSLSSNSSTLPKQNGYANGTKPSQDVGDAVEMESLESFKLKNPYGIRPKPPNTYFNRSSLNSQLSNGSTCSNNTTVKKQRPVSVTIGEYPSATLRRQPGKLEFLNNCNQDDAKNGPKQPITSQFATELQQTLNRSNLRKRTESMENLLNKNIPQIKPQSNGSVRISLSNMSKNLAKSTNDLSSSEMEPLTNRVTININQIEKRNDLPSGILKNSNGNHTLSPQHKPLIHQKSITFGEMPIVINDGPLVT